MMHEMHSGHEKKCGTLTVNQGLGSGAGRSRMIRPIEAGIRRPLTNKQKRNRDIKIKIVVLITSYIYTSCK